MTLHFFQRQPRSSARREKIETASYFCPGAMIAVHQAENARSLEWNGSLHQGVQEACNATGSRDRKIICRRRMNTSVVEPSWTVRVELNCHCVTQCVQIHSNHTSNIMYNKPDLLASTQSFCWGYKLACWINLCSATQSSPINRWPLYTVDDWMNEWMLISRMCHSKKKPKTNVYK